jgi:hypothetical protein
MMFFNYNNYDEGHWIFSMASDANNTALKVRAINSHKKVDGPFECVVECYFNGVTHSGFERTKKS